MTTPLSGLTWGTNTVTWAFAAPGSPDGLGTVTHAITNPAQTATVTAGINEWMQVSGVHLVQVSDPAQADIQVGYSNCSSQGLLGECIWSYNPVTDTYIHALVLLQDPAITPLSPDSNGNLTYSGVVTWLQQLAAHESGAALGLAEGSDPNSILNHVLGTANRLPDAADVAAIDSLYGKPTVSADTLSLVLSEDYWRGNAQFIVKVDGQKVGGPTAVTALRSAGATETFNYTGDWGSGGHTVEIDFINDAYGGSPTMDRNLYVDQVMFNGKAELSSPHALYANGGFVLHL